MDEKKLQYLISSTLQALWDLACHDQTTPDGENCAICSDNDHQAFECEKNGVLKWILNKK